MDVVIASSAEASILEAEAWWRANRPKAPEAFSEEVTHGLELIGFHPSVGAPVKSARLQGVRRIHLSRIHYHLYYQVHETPPLVEVLALWHTSRGTFPPL